MNSNDPEKLFLEKVQGLLNQGTENLESQTERRLMASWGSRTLHRTRQTLREAE